MMDLFERHPFDNITISYDGGAIFTGIIESQSDILRGGGTLHRYSNWKCKDATIRLENRIVNKIYTNMAVEAILADLLASYPCGVTGNNVGITNKTIESLQFPYTPLLFCIRTLADITGWRWYIDADADLHFFDADEGTGATVFSTTTAGGLTRNIRRDSIDLVTEIDARTTNRVWIVGARQASASYTNQYWTGDGNNATFLIAQTPNYPQVFEDGVAKTIELERSDASDKNYTYDKAARLLKRVAGALPSGVVLRLYHRPTIQVIDLFEDSSSIAKYGIYEKAIKDKTVTDKLAARSRGRAELKRRASEITEIQFETRELAVDRGKKYRVVIPELSIDALFLCTGVSTSINAPDTVNITKSVTMEGVT